MSRAALHSAPRASSSNRGEVFQNLLLTTLAVVASSPVGKSADLGLSAKVAVRAFASSEALQRPYQQRFARKPSVGVETSGPAQKLLTGFRAESQSRNIQLFAVAATAPPRSASFSRTVPSPNRREEPQGLNLSLVPSTFTLVISTDDSPRFVKLASPRSDILGSPFGLIQTLVTKPFLNVDFGRPLAQRRLLQADSSTYKVNFSATTALAANQFIYFGRPATNVAIRSDVFGSAPALFSSVVPAITTPRSRTFVIPKRGTFIISKRERG